MSYTEVIEETEAHRVVLHQDGYPSNPRRDGDCYVAVLTQLGDRYAQPDDNHDQRIIDAWEHGRGAWKPNGAFCGTYHDTEKVERYARAYLGAVAVDWLDDPRSSSRIFGYITAEAAQAAGITDPAACLKGELEEYGAYAEGDVYGYVVQQKVHRVVTHDGAVVEDDDDWVDTDDSCWGFYGSEYAEEAAREALAAHAVD